VNNIFLTSSLDLYDKVDGIRIPRAFPNENGIIDEFKKCIKKYDNFVFVASVEDNYEVTDMYSNCTFSSFNKTLPFKNYYVLDGRTKDDAEELIREADFIFLCGGHVPTQNKFFNNINLRELIKNTDAVICGGSAGSMNSADVVYCPPELEGEAIDSNFQKYYRGLGLTNINIFPHFSDIKDEYVDGKNNLNDIIIPDSYKHQILTISDGSYILIKDGKTYIYGDAQLFNKGEMEQICNDGEFIEYNSQNTKEKNNHIL